MRKLVGIKKKQTLNIFLQQQFARLVERHERVRSVQREALRQAEHLFQSLLYEAFSMKLD